MAEVHLKVALFIVGLVAITTIFVVAMRFFSIKEIYDKISYNKNYVIIFIVLILLIFGWYLFSNFFSDEKCVPGEKNCIEITDIKSKESMSGRNQPPADINNAPEPETEVVVTTPDWKNVWLYLDDFSLLLLALLVILAGLQFILTLNDKTSSNLKYGLWFVLILFVGYTAYKVLGLSQEDLDQVTLYGREFADSPAWVKLIDTIGLNTLLSLGGVLLLTTLYFVLSLKGKSTTAIGWGLFILLSFSVYNWYQWNEERIKMTDMYSGKPVPVDLSKKQINAPEIIRMSPNSIAKVILPSISGSRMNQARYPGKVAWLCAEVVKPTFLLNEPGFPQYHVAPVKGNPVRGRVHHVELLPAIKNIMIRESLPWIEVEFKAIAVDEYAPNKCPHSSPA